MSSSGCVRGVPGSWLRGRDGNALEQRPSPILTQPPAGLCWCGSDPAACSCGVINEEKERGKTAALTVAQSPSPPHSG